MELYVPLTGKQRDYLARIVSRAEAKTPDMTAEKWAVARLRAVASSNVRLYYSLDLNGPFDIGGGKKLSVEDLKVFPAESPATSAEAGMTISVASSLASELENAVSMIEAVNRANGADTSWMTFATWLERYIAEEILNARVAAAEEDISA